MTKVGIRMTRRCDCDPLTIEKKIIIGSLLIIVPLRGHKTFCDLHIDLGKGPKCNYKQKEKAVFKSWHDL